MNPTLGQKEASVVWCVTYGGPVFSHKPQVVSEEWKNADAEHGRHKKQKQDVEFGLRLWQVSLREGGEKKESRETRINNEQDVGDHNASDRGHRG